MENPFDINTQPTQGVQSEVSQRHLDRDNFVQFIESNLDTFNSSIEVISSEIDGVAPGSVIAYTATFGTKSTLFIAEFRSATNIALSKTGAAPLAFKSLDAIQKYLSKLYGIVLPTQADVELAGKLIQLVNTNGTACLDEVAKLVAKIRANK